MTPEYEKQINQEPERAYTDTLIWFQFKCVAIQNEYKSKFGERSKLMFKCDALKFKIRGEQI